MAGCLDHLDVMAIVSLSRSLEVPTLSAPHCAPRPSQLPGAVKVQASKVQEVAKKAAAVAATLPALVASSPAFALVSERGLSFGRERVGAELVCA